MALLYKVMRDALKLILMQLYRPLVMGDGDEGIKQATFSGILRQDFSDANDMFCIARSDYFEISGIPKSLRRELFTFY